SGKYIVYSMGSSIYFAKTGVSSRWLLYLLALAAILVGALYKREESRALFEKVRSIYLRGLEARDESISRIEEEAPELKELAALPQAVEPEVAKPEKVEEVGVQLARVTFKVISHKSKRGISGVEVTFGGVRKLTDSRGEVNFTEVPVGEHEVTARKDFYETKTNTYSAEDKAFYEIELKPTVKLEELHLKKLKKAKLYLENSLENVSNYDLCIPSYYTGIGNRVVEFVEKLSNNPEYFEEQGYGATTDYFADVALDICIRLSELMTDWKNVQLYRRAGAGREECPAGDFIDERAVDEAGREPRGFVDANYPRLKERLAEVDSTITSRIKDLTIMPVSGIWRIAEQLFIKAAEEEGSKKAFLMVLADAMLSYAEEMFENQMILARLRYTII
ncbi:MAG: carboxypeptidase-like regulatory domain-containing protein, partial [Candidatus Hydrothermarchaeaceae archaeon]